MITFYFKKPIKINAYGKKNCTIVNCCFGDLRRMQWPRTSRSPVQFPTQTVHPVAGATVMVDGTSVGTTTNAARRSTRLSAPRLTALLLVTFIGYEPQQLADRRKNPHRRRLMKEDTQAIDDVIVVAFGTAKKEAFTGSASVDEGRGYRQAPGIQRFERPWRVPWPVCR